MILLNDKPIDFFKFPGGEIQVNIGNPTTERVVITWKPADSDDIMKLFLTVNALLEKGIHDIDVDVLYLPYARQDRVCSSGEAFSLKVICSMLSTLDVSCLRLWDVHNQKKVFELLRDEVYCLDIETKDIFARYHILKDFDLSNLVLCAPDKGAEWRVEQIERKLGLQTPVYLHKERDPILGIIKRHEFLSWNRSIDGFNIMVVDDICDGGSTFINAAECLKEKSAEDLFLYVTHGIFSKGLDELKLHYKHIYCHHVLDDARYQSDSFLTILREFPSDKKPTICN